MPAKPPAGTSQIDAPAAISWHSGLYGGKGRLQGQLAALERAARSRKMGPRGTPAFLTGRQRGDSAMLLFKKKFLDAIRGGEKTQTIRLWKYRMMRAGQRSYIPGIGPIRITTVEPVEVDALTDADAIPDGFPTAVALAEGAAHHLRREARQGHQAFRIVFE